MLKKRRRSVSLYLLLAALLFLGLNAVAGGFVLVADPAGSTMGLSVGVLQGSPFSNFLIPGLVLLLVLGVFPLIVVYGLWARRWWSWRAALLVGPAVIVWLIVEILVVGYHSQPPLQLVIGLLGLTISVLVLLPSVRLDSGAKSPACTHSGV